MARPNAERIGSLLPEVLKRMGERHSALFDIQRDWARLVGRRVAAHTRPVSVRRGVLTVHTHRPGDGYALTYQKPELLKRLRAMVPGKVEEIVIRPGNVAGPR